MKMEFCFQSPATFFQKCFNHSSYVFDLEPMNIILWTMTIAKFFFKSSGYTFYLKKVNFIRFGSNNVNFSPFLLIITTNNIKTDFFDELTSYFLTLIPLLSIIHVPREMFLKKTMLSFLYDY